MIDDLLQLLPFLHVMMARIQFRHITLGGRACPGHRDQSCGVLQICRASVSRLVRTGSAWSLWEKRPALGWEFEIQAAVLKHSLDSHPKTASAGSQGWDFGPMVQGS